MKKSERNLLIATTIIFWLIIICIGPMDLFHHGYYCDVVDWNIIEESDRLGYVDLKEQEFKMNFVPIKKHFVGLGINLSNQPEDNTGFLEVVIRDSNAKKIESVKVDLNKVKEDSWYWLYFNKSLKQGKTYTLTILPEDCKTTPYLKRVHSDYLTKENTVDNILIGFAYAKSTFDFANKVLISMFVISIWAYVCSSILRSSNKKGSITIKYLAYFVFSITILAWTYLYNSMDTGNTGFTGFQADSESLVTAMIKAEHYEEKEDINDLKYGLALYSNIEGNSYYRTKLITDVNWTNGYSNTIPAIVINSNEYTRKIAKIGNFIRFENNNILQITNITDDGNNIVLDLSSNKVLSETKYGSLIDATFYNSQMIKYPKGELSAYESQYGLQGKIFKHIAQYMNYENITINLNLLCCVLTAFVFTVIILLVGIKYNNIYAFCFFITFWLSPWIVNFARNLYWVEFTWFVPTVIGLFCSWKIDNKKCRIMSYMAAFIAITLKCLCGYEYITSIMMQLIIFLLTDLINAVLNHNRKKQDLIFKTIFILGITAIVGFMTAICIHAPLRGDGNIFEGIKNIFEQDVLRRTTGADLNEYMEYYWPSFQVSIWEVFCAYFKFPTQVIAGIDGNLFPLLCIIPMIIYITDYKKGKRHTDLLALYSITFLTAISWFCLAKAHSYVHRHMNYVLWYTGYVQTCLYIVMNWILDKSNIRRIVKRDKLAGVLE